MSEEQNKHGVVTFASGDSGTAKDVLTIPENENLDVEDLVYSYAGSGTTDATVSLYDEEEGSGAGSVSDSNLLDSVSLTSGDQYSETGVTREDVSDDVVAVVDGNDADVNIVVSGTVV